MVMVTKMILPTGENLHKSLASLTDEQVQHEYDLCYEILHGVHVDGELLIEGMLHIDADQRISPEAFEAARKTWLRRLEVAKMELLERSILLS